MTLRTILDLTGRVPMTGLDWGSVPLAVLPLVIFAMRTSDITLATLRLLALVHGRKALAWVAGFLQALLFVTAVAGVLANLENLWNVVAYAAGMATGNVLGIALEAKIAPGHSLLQIVSARRGSAVVEMLRHKGWGATEVAGTGINGTVSLILSYIPRRRIPHLKEQVLAVDDEAFISVEHVRELRGGWNS